MSTPTGPNPPPLPPNIPPSSASEGPSAAAGQGSSQISNSPFAKMFPGGASPEQLTQFINNYLRMMITQFQQQNQSWQRAQQRLKEIEEGNDPD